MARKTQALICTFTSAVATLGRLEVSGTWNKDPRRPVKVLILPGQVKQLEEALGLFRQGRDMQVEVATSKSAKKGSREPVAEVRRGFKTVG